ncbi:Fructosamine kinase-domain-containing protein [Xylaria sp. FL1042]|nr:Fructosamine kinase-domain-containing protein [Xylaria sp. FL1042]
MGNEHTEFTGEVDAHMEAIPIIDPGMIAKLPPGASVSSIVAHGASFWTRTARLDAELGGAEQSYFLKMSFGECGKMMMSGEFHCMTKIYSIMPDLVPKPIARGTYSSIPDVHFFLCDFRPMTDGLPDLETFPEKMGGDMHRTGVSQNGKFGFDVTTFHGNIPVEHDWSDTWEEYFTRKTRALFELEQEAQGQNEEIRKLMIPFFEKVVPHLLRPLIETGGRSIQPSLIHGDLWHDELGVWRQPWNKIKKDYRMRYYRKRFPKSQPEGDYDDRNAL